MSGFIDAQAGSAGSAANNAVTPVAGSDGTTFRTLKTDSTGALAVTGGGTPTGTAGSPNAAVVTVQGISGGTVLPTGGDVASGSADSGNPVKMGAKYNATQPTFTDGQRGDAQIDSRGNLRVSLLSPGNVNAVNVNAANANADGQAAAYSLYTFAQGGVYNGSNWDRQRGDVNATSVLPGLSSTQWAYAAASGGISNTTTAVTIKAAAGASVRNYITSLQINTDGALGAATEVAVRDGASGTVIWRTKIGTAGIQGGMEVVFPMPLKGTANTLLEVVTLTASVTGAVYINAQGFTGS